MKRDITQILRKDQEKLSTNEKFVDANMKQYELAIDTWLEMMPDTLAPYMVHMMETDGLVDTIQCFSKIADDWLRCLEEPEWESSPDRDPSYDFVRGQLRSEGLRGFLQACRYLKRFQPMYADKLLAQTLSQFKITHNIAKLHNRADLSKPGYLSDILDRASDLLSILMGSVPTKNEYFELGRMTPGKDPTDIKPIAQKWARARFERLEDRPFATSLCLPLTPGKVDRGSVTNLPSGYSKSFRLHQGYATVVWNNRIWIYAKPIIISEGEFFYSHWGSRAYKDFCHHRKELTKVMGVPENTVRLLLCSKVESHPTGIYGNDVELLERCDLKDTTAYVHGEWIPLDRENLMEILKEEILPIRFGDTIDLIAYFTAMVEVVPKNYKTGRVIAREDPTRQWCLTALREKTYQNMYKSRDKLEKELKEFFISTSFPLPVDPEREQPSQIRAYIGSVGGRCATIDWSSASDLLSYKLVARVMPKPHFRARLRYRAQYLSIKGTTVVNHFWSTMGAANTWADMSMVLWSICVAVSESVGRLCGYNDLVVPVLWGDDTVVDVRVAEATVDVLETLGMKCNREKSYWRGDYRESCGAEFFRGEEVSTVYWPRRAMLYDNAHRAETYAMLLDLQHRLWDYPTVATRITKDLQDIAGEDFMSCQPLDDWSLPWSPLPTKPKKVINLNYAWDRMEVKEVKKIEADYMVLKTTVEPEAPHVPVDLHTNPTYRNYLMYKYYEYLRFGPKLSEDPLMRSLGLTMSRIAGGDFGGEKPQLAARLKFE
jgi:hypothetical protein